MRRLVSSVVYDVEALKLLFPIMSKNKTKSRILNQFLILQEDKNIKLQ